MSVLVVHRLFLKITLRRVYLSKLILNGMAFPFIQLPLLFMNIMRFPENSSRAQEKLATIYG